MILQCNPHASYVAHKKEIDEAVARVFDSGWYILGKEVKAFEADFANYLAIEHAVGVANGTDAIELALRAAGIGEGDAVATVSHTAVATVAAIDRCGAVPQFVDVDAYFTMSVESLSEALQRCPEIKAVVVVHLYGQMADMAAILDLAKQHGIPVVEDCAQAHGAELDGEKAGTWGDFGCFSFYPTKNLGGMGDGGAVVTRDREKADRLREIQQYGWKERYISETKGVNSRLDELQAAILRVKLPHLDADNTSRRRIAVIYCDALQGRSNIQCPELRDDSYHVYHQFVVQCSERDQRLSKLKSEGVCCGIHYPMPIHRQPAYDRQAYQPVTLMQTDALASQIMSLPIYPEMTIENAEAVAAAILRE